MFEMGCFIVVLVAAACGRAGEEGTKRGRDERLGECVDTGGWVLCVRGGGVGLRFDCDGVRAAVDCSGHR